MGEKLSAFCLLYAELWKEILDECDYCWVLRFQFTFSRGLYISFRPCTLIYVAMIELASSILLRKHDSLQFHYTSQSKYCFCQQLVFKSFKTISVRSILLLTALPFF